MYQEWLDWQWDIWLDVPFSALFDWPSNWPSDMKDDLDPDWMEAVLFY